MDKNMAEELKKLKFKLEHKRVLIFWIILFLFTFWGLYLRLDLYIFNRSIWYDEAALWMNVKQSGVLELFGVLKYNQAAPAGFLLESKVLVKLFGDSEYVLRFIPLFCGLCAIPAFFWMTNLFLHTKSAKLFAILLFMVNTNLIFYCQEFKQYSGDVLIAILLACVAVEVKMKKPVLTGLFFALCLWYSHPAIFVTAGIWCAFLIRSIRKKLYGNFSIFSVIIALNALICYFVSFKPLQNQEFLNSVWATSFINKDFSNLFELVMNNFYYIFQPIKLFPQEHAIWTPVILFSLFAAGAVFVFKQDRKGKFRFDILILPYLFVLLAAYFDIYPYYDRVTLFLTPFFIITAAKVFDKIEKFHKTSFVLLILSALLLINPSIQAQKHMKDMPNQNKLIFKELERRYRKGQTVVVNPISALSYKYYSHRRNFKAPSIEEKTYKNQIEYINFLLTLKNSDGYWFYTTNMFENYDTKDLIQLWGQNKREFFHYNVRKSDLYYVRP